MVDPDRYRVPPERLRWTCDPQSLPFETTRDLSPPTTLVGQERVERALELGLGVDRPGYNLFVTGQSGMGRVYAIQTHLRRMLEERERRGDLPPPSDWCIVHNFQEPDRPRVLRLPRGRGRAFRSAMNRFIAQLHPTLTQTFQSDLYQVRRRQLQEQHETAHRQIREVVERFAQSQGFMVQQTPEGVAIIPVYQGRPLPPDVVLALPEAERQALETRRRRVMEAMEEASRRAQELERQLAQQMEQLNRETARQALEGLLGPLREEFQDLPEVLTFLEQVGEFVLGHLTVYLQTEPPQALLPAARVGDPYTLFRVNLFVDNAETKGVPVIYEPAPTYANLFGTIERRFVMGAYYTDHTMIRAGAVSRANGGYLLLHARDALMYPGVWEGLKRVLGTRTLRLEDSPLEQMGFPAPVGLRPEPIPTEVKVILIGDPFLYYLLHLLDPEMWEFFKVRADFNPMVPRTNETVQGFAQVVCALCQQEGLLPFDRTAVARLLEHSARMVEDQEHLSSRFGLLRDVMVEADFWARKAGRDRVLGEDVERALQERFYRSSLIAERIRDLIAEGTLVVQTEGMEVGQVNGLVVRNLGDITFGHPTRITARTYMGQEGVVNIERESRLSGRIHDKGVLILQGYLAWKYAQAHPLSLGATLCFEQSYEGVEGDSASSTELYALLSSLSGLPVRQDLAVTGAVDQRGQVQAIGGVNEKIEGWYEVCKARGLTGTQGVIIPEANLKHLMLKPEVVEAVRQGRFHIYAVRTVDEGISLLTGVPAGERGPDGRYPEGTVNERVARRLRELAEGIRAFGRPPEEKREEEGEGAPQETPGEEQEE